MAKYGNMKNRNIYWGRYKIQETLYIEQWCLSPLQSRHLGTSHSSPNHHQLPLHIFLNLINSLKSKVILVLGKTKSLKAPNLGCRGAESPGGFDILPQNSAQDVMHEWVCCPDEAANHSLLIAVAFWVTWIVTWRNVKFNAKFDTDALLYLLSHFECSGRTVHTLTQLRLPQWSRHCSHMHSPVHSPWLPGYISIAQTVLIVLIMTGLFPDRTRTIYYILNMYFIYLIYVLYLNIMYILDTIYNMDYNPCI